MNTPEKCQAILEQIVKVINTGRKVTFEEDFGGNTLTIYMDNDHTHCGVPGGPDTFEVLVNNLYNALTNGPGLSWFPAEPGEVLNTDEPERTKENPA